MSREYVALERLEGKYALNPLFASLLVHGDSTRSHLVALAVLDPLVAANYVSSVLGQPYGPSDIVSLEKAVQDKRVKTAVIKGMEKVARENKLNG